jgi:phosphorylcholine metabolism protein LicD
MVEPRSLIRTMSQINQNFQAARQEIMDEHPNFDKINDRDTKIKINIKKCLKGIFLDIFLCDCLCIY